MKRSFSKQMIVASIGFGLACGSLNSCNSMSDSSLAQLQGTGLGGAVGAGIGTGVGAIAGGSSGAAKGAVIGGVIGAIAGNLWAQHVVKKKQEFASREAWLKANIKSLDSRISDTQKLNQSLNKQIASLRSSNSKLSKSDYAAIKKNVNEKVSIIDADISTTKNNMKGENLADSDVATLNAKLTSLQKERAALMSSLATLGASSSAA